MALDLDFSPDELKIFVEEGEEQLEALAQGLLALERSADDADLLQRIFRAAHTLKGSSGAVRHQRMADLTHAMESVLDLVRSDEMQVTGELIDLLLRGSDALAVLLAEVTAPDEEPELDVTPLVAATRGYAETSKSPTDGASKASKPGKAKPKSLASKGRRSKKTASQPGGRPAWLTPVQDGGAAYALRDAGAEEPPRAGETSPPGHKGPGGEQRLIDLGPEARGKGPQDMLKLAAQRTSAMSKTLRVDVARLDNLMNLVGELVIERTRLIRIANHLAEKCQDEELAKEMLEVCRHVGRITDEVQDELMKSRMLPMDSVFGRFPRLVRDLAQLAGKQINFVVEGGGTELDRSVSEVIGDPLVHLLRNAVDHGMETPERRRAVGKPESGTVRLSAQYVENQIVIAIEDDGPGINVERVKAKAIAQGLVSKERAERMPVQEAVNLIFSAGLSTAEKITTISGRGVGMDIVRANIEKLNGSVAVSTEFGKGSKFTIRLPLTLASVPALLVSLRGRPYAIPLTSVVEAFRVDRAEIKSARDREIIQIRGQALPLVRCDRLLKLRGDEEPDKDGEFVVQVRWAARSAGLVVDALIGEQQIVVKPFGKLVGEVQGISGGAVLRDGRIAPVLDIPSLIKMTIREAA